jgi:tetratricopeptide (TPR) repeat protein
MKKDIKIISVISFASLLIGACVEKPIKLVIDPPAGAGSESNITYESEDRTSGKNEKLVIPVAQIPKKLVIDQKNSVGESMPSPTLADGKFISELDQGNGKKPPSVSYLKGLEEVESLYRSAKFQDALIQLAPLIQDYPRVARLHMMEGTIYRRLGEKKMAYKSYQKALELDKDNLKVQQALDSLQAQAGDIKP